MFDNLITQNASIVISEDIRNDRLPQSLLFSGARCSGKMTAALELARIVSCEAVDEKALWLCTCRSCLLHKSLSHHELLIMGQRDCIPEIRAAQKNFESALMHDASYKQAAQYLFIRSVRKLTCRFNPILWEADDTKLQRASSLLADIDEILEELHPLRPISDTQKSIKHINSLVSICEKMDASFLYDTIPVSQVRSAAQWSHIIPSSKKKTIIIENADKMQESARNAFLKILEEPPEDVLFILLTTQRNAMMQTILSRVRTYHFTEREIKFQREVISRVFHDEADSYESISAYLKTFLPVSPHDIKLAACRFMRRALDIAVDEGRKPSEALGGAVLEALTEIPDVSLEKLDTSATLAEIVSFCKGFEMRLMYRLFLEQLLAILRRSLRQSAVQNRDHIIAEKWLSYMRKASEHVGIFNQSPNAALEILLQDMKDAL